MALSDWIEELRQRRVLRTLLAYGVVVFAVLQVIEPVLHGLRLPDWSLTAVVIGLALGFPLVGLIAWLLDAQRRPASPRAHSAHVRNRRLALGLGALALAAAVVTGLVLYRSRTLGPPTGGLPSIAVLPFVNLSEDSGQDYFADGLTEEIQSALAQIAGLRVIGRTSSSTFKGKPVDLNEVARKLGVTSVLEGSVRRAGSRLRINAQIVDTRDGYHRWSRSYEREIGDVFAIQDEIGRAVAHALQLTLLPKERTVERRPVSPEAMSKYLLARRFLTRSSLDNFVRAAAASEEAIALAPSFAPAWATLASANGGIADWTEDLEEVQSDQKKAMEAAARAISLDPGLAEAYAVRAQMLASLAWDWEGAGEDYDRALALAPGDADILRKHGAWYLAPLGRLSEAIAELRTATGLDPLSASAWVSLGILQVAVGQGDEGERTFHRVLGDRSPERLRAGGARRAPPPGGKARGRPRRVREVRGPHVAALGHGPRPARSRALRGIDRHAERARGPLRRSIAVPGRPGPCLARRAGSGVRVAREGLAGARQRVAAHPVGPAAPEPPRGSSLRLLPAPDEPARGLVRLRVLPRGTSRSWSSPSPRRVASLPVTRRRLPAPRKRTPPSPRRR